jgi:hypothetical protein
MTAASTNSSVYYTPNGTALTSKALRILGYVEYSAGLATAGTYASAPTTVQLFGPGVKKPGDTVQTVYGITTSNTITTTSGVATNMNVGAGIAPTSAINWVAVEIMFAWQTTANSVSTFIISRGTAPSSVGVSLPTLGNSSVGFGSAGYMKAFDTATTATRSSYNLFCTLTSGGGGGQQMQVTGSQNTILTEIMG